MENLNILNSIVHPQQQRNSMPYNLILSNTNKVAQISDEDIDKVIQLSISLDSPWKENPRGYPVIEKRSFGVTNYHFLHKFILGNPKHTLIDHIDRDRLNCKRDNLRFATESENQANTGIRKDSSSGYKGINQCKSSGKWRVRIQIDYKSITIGQFICLKEAVEAYNRKAFETHGEFAFLNPIDNIQCNCPLCKVR